jgi:hypothetical protein
VQAEQPKPLDPPVARLVEQLGDPVVDRRFEAARELAAVEEPQVINVLADMVDRDINRREALAALLLSKEPSAAKVLAAARVASAIDAQVRALEHELQTRS